MKRFNARVMIAALAFLAAALGGVARAATDAQLVADARKTLAAYQRTDPSLRSFIEDAAGYAVFPSVLKGGIGVGGAHGDGVLFERGVPVGRASLTQVSVGAQLGGQEYSEIVFFETPQALAQFKRGEFTFAAQATAVALKSGAAANARFKDNVAVFTSAKGGLMFEASLGGQKFKFEPFAPAR
jgi:lipid-binding SYLF domain-containing protein